MFGVAAPEKKQRLPSAYNRFMRFLYDLFLILNFQVYKKKQRMNNIYKFLLLFRKLKLKRDEIQRIKSANPEIPHREAFSAAAKNVRKYIVAYFHESNNTFTNFICVNETCGQQWAKYIPNSPTSITSGGSNIHVSYTN